IPSSAADYSSYLIWRLQDTLHNVVRFEKNAKIFKVRSAAAVADEFQIMFVASLPGEESRPGE
ncbi:hypothetical protein PHLCEN_2v10172, partial [Hermanssonia centrifuga]